MHQEFIAQEPPRARQLIAYHKQERQSMVSPNSAKDILKLGEDECF